MDWKKYRLPIGAGVLVLLVGASVWAMNRREQATEQELVEKDAKKAIPEIKKEGIDELEVRRPDAKNVRVKKDGDTWKLVAPLEARADQNTVSTALDKISDLEVATVAATKAKHHELLEVSEGKGVHVLPKKGGKTMAHLIVGAYRGSNTMLRIEGEDRVLGVSGSIRYAFTKDLKNWRDRKVVDHSPSDIKGVVFENEHGKFSFARDESDDWKKVKVDPEPEKYDGSSVQSKVASLSRTRAVDFAAKDMAPKDAGLGKSAAKVTLILAEDEPGGSTGDGGAAAQGGDAGAGTQGGSDTGTMAMPEGDERIVLHVGKKVKDKKQYYLQREGEDTIYIISEHTAGKAKPEPKDFGPNASKGSKGGKAGPAAMKKMKMKMKMGGARGGGRKLPPGVMKKLRKQMQRRKAAGR